VDSGVQRSERRRKRGGKQSRMGGPFSRVGNGQGVALGKDEPSSAGWNTLIRGGYLRDYLTKIKVGKGLLKEDEQEKGRVAYSRSGGKKEIVSTGT